MRITLISTYTHPIALGLRSVSAYLKAAGHDVEMIFMSSKRDTARPDVPPAEFSEPEIEGKRLIESEGGLVISRTHIKGGAEVTIRAGRSVAFGNGFQVGPQARLAVGGGSVGGEPKSREAQNG